jgi:hypothetical protein
MKSGAKFTLKSGTNIGFAAIVCASVLTACGGDGAGSPTPTAAPTPPPTASTPDVSAPTAITTAGASGSGAATLTSAPLVTQPSVTAPVIAAPTEPARSAPLIITGVAATGAAMASATVTAKCAVGAGTSVTNGDGAYSIKINAGLLPCVVQAKSADGAVELHAAAEASALNFITANITPLTELVVSRLHGNSGANLFANFEANKAKIDNINLAIATEKIRAILAPLVNLQNVDPHKALLVAATASTNGNAHDKILDALRDALALANVKLPDLVATLTAKTDVEALAAIRNLLSVVTPPPVVTLPPIAACQSLKSGVFRVIEPAAPTQYYELIVDATALKVTSPLGTEQFTANGCLLSSPSTGSTIAMSPQGAGVMRTGAGTIAAVIPKQDLTLADLAGSWSYVGRSRPPGTQNYASMWGQMAFNTTGAVTSGQLCASRGCTPIDLTKISAFTKNTMGYFNESTGRYFPFKTTSGSMGMLSINAEGGDPGVLLFFVKGPSIDLPSLNTIQNSFELNLSAAGSVGIGFVQNSTQTTDSFVPGNTYKQFRTSDCRLESFSINQPFGNLLTRNATVYTSCASNSTLINDNLIASSVKGLGVSISVSVMAGHMIFAVEK